MKKDKKKQKQKTKNKKTTQYQNTKRESFPIFSKLRPNQYFLWYVYGFHLMTKSEIYQNLLTITPKGHISLISIL